jgi:hypothetical protein
VAEEEDGDEEEEVLEAEKDMKKLSKEEKKELKQMFFRYIMSKKQFGPRRNRLLIFKSIWKGRKARNFGFGPYPPLGGGFEGPCGSFHRGGPCGCGSPGPFCGPYGGFGSPCGELGGFRAGKFGRGHHWGGPPPCGGPCGGFGGPPPFEDPCSGFGDGPCCGKKKKGGCKRNWCGTKGPVETPPE